MKFVNAQMSADLLRYVLPTSAMDHTRYQLLPKEADALHDIWLNARQIIQGKFLKTADMDSMVLLSLTNKGYITLDGSYINFTDLGKEAIKKIVLNSEKSAFEKQGK